MTAGLNVPADSQPAPSGERIGASDARRQDPNGHFSAAVPATAARSNSVTAVLALISSRPVVSLPLRLLASLPFVEAYRPHNALAFLHVEKLIALQIFQRIDLPARPANLQQLNFLR